MTMHDTLAKPTTAAPHPRVTTTWILLTVQSALFVLGGLFLWTWEGDGRRRFTRRFLHEQLAVHPLRWGLLLIVIGAVLAVTAVGVAHRRAWATVSVYMVEPIVALGSLLRFHPVRSVVGVGLAVAVLVLASTNANEKDLSTSQR